MVKERKKVKKRKSKKTDKEETLHDGNNQVEHPGASEESTCEKCAKHECFEHPGGLGPARDLQDMEGSQDTDGFVHKDDVDIHNA